MVDRTLVAQSISAPCDSSHSHRPDSGVWPGTQLDTL